MSALRQRNLDHSPDRAVRVRLVRTALPAALFAALAACHSPATRVAAPDRPPPAPNPQEPEDRSYDWHGLLIAPFGSVLKDIPLALHEVLLFRDEAKTDEAAGADAECYGTDTPAPRFVGRTPDEYLLCFAQDRLSRIRASVRLATAQASEVFAAACADWLRNAAAAPATGAPSVAVPSAVVRSDQAQSESAPSSPLPTAEARSGAVCEGRDGAIRFIGRLGEEAGQAELPETETMLFITLDSVQSP